MTHQLGSSLCSPGAARGRRGGEPPIDPVFQQERPPVPARAKEKEAAARGRIFALSRASRALPGMSLFLLAAMSRNVLPHLSVGSQPPELIPVLRDRGVSGTGRKRSAFPNSFSVCRSESTSEYRGLRGDLMSPVSL